VSAQARPLDPAEHEAFRTVRLVAAEVAPYFMHALFAAAPLAAPGLGTFAVDEHWRLYLDPACLLGPGAWLPVEAAGVLVHEVGHLLREHSARAGALAAPVDRLAWNLAGDAEINDDLLAAGIVLPSSPVTPEALGCAPGDLAEAYYASLVRPGTAPLPDDGGPGCGSGSGSGSLRVELPAGTTLPDGSGAGLAPADGDLVRRKVALAVQEHVTAKGRGSLPAGLPRWAAGVLAPPTVSWRRVLGASVRRALAVASGRWDYSYVRPSRRPTGPFIKPSMRTPLLSAALVVDTSGSMSQGDLDAAMSEVTGVLHTSGVARDRVMLLSCDAATTQASPIRSVTSVRLVGGGGTDMRVGIAAAERLRPTPDVTIVLTDGDTPWPQAPTRTRLVCAIVSVAPPTRTPPWATTVHIPPRAAA